MMIPADYPKDLVDGQGPSQGREGGREKREEGRAGVLHARGAQSDETVPEGVVWTVEDFDEALVGEYEGEKYPTLDGKLLIFNQYFPDFDIETEVVESLTTEDRLVMRARIVDEDLAPVTTWIRGTSHREADADLWSKAVEIAESRAIGRRLRFSGIGVGAPGLEEVTGKREPNLPTLDATETVLIASPNDQDQITYLEDNPKWQRSPSLGAWFTVVDTQDAPTVKESLEEKGLSIQVRKHGGA